MPSQPGEERKRATAENDRWSAMALGFTAAILGFVGTLVVLTIPFAILSIPMPPDVNRAGLTVETTRILLFERPWLLLIPALLLAAWIGIRSYRWYYAAT